jgi:hypothetical protein
MRTNPPLEPLQVALFICLHEESVDDRKSRVETRSRNGLEERVVVFEVDGKYRPCLILGQKTRYWLIWKLTGTQLLPPLKPLRRLVSLKRLDNIPTPSYLRDRGRYPNEIVWIHEQLARDLIGHVVDRNEHKYLYDQVKEHNGYGPRVHVGQTCRKQDTR